MNAAKLNIMVLAFKIRLEKGESLEEILNSYPMLEDSDKTFIIEKITQ